MSHDILSQPGLVIFIHEEDESFRGYIYVSNSFIIVHLSFSVGSSVNDRCTIPYH